MSGGTGGTTGGPPRDGSLGVPWMVWAVVGAVSAAFFIVNVGNVVMEDARRGVHTPLWRPLLFEGSSAIAALALLPGVAWAERRLRPALIGWPRAIAGHLAVCMAFSALHVAAMVAMREAAFAALSLDYAFGPPLQGFVYEARKDALTYALFLTAFAIHRAGLFQPRPAELKRSGSTRIEVRDGARRLFLVPQDVFWVEAAGNYVELQTAGRAHLMRATLAAMEARLSPDGFVRIHRSRLVNAALVRGVATNDSGDFEVTLTDGRTLAGSRRYRAALEEALARPAS